MKLGPEVEGRTQVRADRIDADRSDGATAGQLLLERGKVEGHSGCWWVEPHQPWGAASLVAHAVVVDVAVPIVVGGAAAALCGAKVPCEAGVVRAVAVLDLLLNRFGDGDRLGQVRRGNQRRLGSRGDVTSDPHQPAKLPKPQGQCAIDAVGLLCSHRRL